ncbi:unnamed protein product [Calypogeia fissa]
MRTQIYLLALALLLSCAVSSARAQICFNDTTYTMNTADVQYIDANLPNSSVVTVAAGSFYGWYWNTALFCISNLNNQTDNVTTASVIASGVSIANLCCKDTLCKGGLAFLDGPTATKALLHVQPINTTCSLL